MLVFEFKAYGKPEQFKAVDDAKQFVVQVSAIHANHGAQCNQVYQGKRVFIRRIRQRLAEWPLCTPRDSR